MRLKRSVLFTSAALLIAALLVLCFVPFIVAGGLRIWVQRAAQREGLRVEFGEIEAPFLRPVVLRNVRVQSRAGMPFQIEGTAARMELGLNLAGIFQRAKRPLRHLNIDGLNLAIRAQPGETSPSHGAPWSILKNLQADSFKFTAVDLHLENAVTTVDLRDGALTGSELEAGTLTAREIRLASPWFRKTLTDVSGATSWQDNRLSLGALSLMRGFDIDTIAIDLSQIGDSRIGMEVNVDAFGGKIRARISSDDRGGKRTWDVVGNGSGISLAEMSDALEWDNRASGVLHASKFTFRGEMSDLRNATAAIWAEISGMTWRDRTADTVMIGASLYNREVQVEQLYIKQRNNQLTLSGEFALPQKLGSEIRPAFRGDLSASINDLGEFARLFGWSPADFAGQLSASGAVNVHEGKFGGRLSVSGNTLVLFRSPIESLEMKLDLEESRVTVAQFELRQTGDFFHGEGSFSLTGDHAYSGAFQASAAEIANYRGSIPKTLPLEGSVAAEWKGRGSNTGGSGTFQAHAQNLRVADGPFLPFNVELDAEYSAENIFFRQFHLWNQHADLNAFVGLAKNYLQVQDLRFDLNGHSRVTGNVFLPVAASEFRDHSSWIAALGPDPFFDVDLAVDTLDLAELAAAIKTKPDLSGHANVRLQLSGMPASLQGKSEIQLRDFVFDNSPALTANVDAGFAFGVVNLKSDLVVRGSNPVTATAAVPLRLEKRGDEFALASNGPLSATVDFPALFLAKLPSYIARGVFTRGILSGNFSVSDSVQEPEVTGSANLVDGELLGGPAISGGIVFSGRNAALNYAHWKDRDVDLSARGKIEFNNLANIHVTVWPNTALTPIAALRPDDCVNAVAFFSSPSISRLTGAVNRIDLERKLSGAGWIISLSEEPPDGDADNEAPLPQSFPICRDGKTLSLGVAPALFP
jgi:hypothetical protein